MEIQKDEQVVVVSVLDDLGDGMVEVSEGVGGDDVGGAVDLSHVSPVPPADGKTNGVQASGSDLREVVVGVPGLPVVQQAVVPSASGGVLLRVSVLVGQVQSPLGEVGSDPGLQNEETSNVNSSEGLVVEGGGPGGFLVGILALFAAVKLGEAIEVAGGGTVDGSRVEVTLEVAVEVHQVLLVEGGVAEEILRRVDSPIAWPVSTRVGVSRMIIQRKHSSRATASTSPQIPMNLLNIGTVLISLKSSNINSRVQLAQDIPQVNSSLRWGRVLRVRHRN